MDLVEVFQLINQSSMEAYGLSDMAVGTVTKTAPLEVTIQKSMAPLPQEVLHLTEAVVEKKIPILAHRHTTAGFRHSHEVETAERDYETSAGLLQDSYISDQQLANIICYEDGKPLPVEDGYIILNRALAVGDKVLLLRCMRGQQFIILSRIFERGRSDANAATG